MKWLVSTLLFFGLGALLRGYLRSDHLHDPNADHDSWKKHHHGGHSGPG